jgi:predicted ArsR family transcriptional regulator
MPTTRAVLAHLFERGPAGLTATEASVSLGVKYNSAAIALVRLLDEDWCTVETERGGRTGRPCKRYTIKGDT